MKGHTLFLKAIFHLNSVAVIEDLLAFRGLHKTDWNVIRIKTLSYSSMSFKTGKLLQQPEVSVKSLDSEAEISS